MLGFWRMAELAADIEKGEGQGPHKTRTPYQARRLLDDAVAETRTAVQAARPGPKTLPA